MVRLLARDGGRGAYFSCHLCETVSNNHREDVQMEHTRMLVLKLGQVVDIFIDHNVEIVGLVVACHVGSSERLGHGEEKEPETI